MDGLQKKKNEKRKKEIKDKRDAPVASGSAATGGSFGTATPLVSLSFLFSLVFNSFFVLFIE